MEPATGFWVVECEELGVGLFKCDNRVYVEYMKDV